MSLTYFTVVGAYFAAMGESSYDAGDPDLAPMSGTVTFTPMLSNGDPIQPDALDPAVNVVLGPVKVLVKNGQLKVNGEAGVRLLANTAGLNLTSDLYYRVDFNEGLIARGRSFPLKPFTFPAPPGDSVVDLAGVTPSASGTAVAATDRGPRGYTTKWVVVNPGPPKIWQQYITETNTYVGDPIDYVPDVSADVATQVSTQVPPAVTAYVPGAVTSDLAGRDMDITDAGGGSVQFTLGGVDVGSAFPLPAAVWSGITGKPTWTSSFFTADVSTTAADITAWLAVPFDGWKRLVGSATLNDAIIIPSDTWLDAAGATITQTPGTNKRMVQNTAVTPLRATSGDAVVTAGDNTVTTATGAFTSADIGRVLQVAFVDEATYGTNVYGTITAINSSTSVEVTPAPLYTESGGVARIYGRDKNIHIVGGIWDHGANDGGALNGNFIHLRRIDSGSVRGLECRSTAGHAYAISPGDVTDFLVEGISGAVNSALVQFAGPGKNITMRNIRGVTQDDLTAFTTTDYGEWNDCHGSYENIVVESISGDPGTYRMLLIAGTNLFRDGGTGPNLPDGHSYNGVTVRDVTNTGAGASSGIVTWAQCDDPTGRIDNLSITNADCRVQLRHNAHGKVRLENVSGTVTATSMPSGYPNTASLIDDLTLVNCAGMIDTNDTRSTITKLTIRGGAIPFLYLGCAAVDSALMDRVTFLDRLFEVNSGCSVGVLTFAHCTGTMGSTDGIGLIDGSSSVDEINVHDSPLTSTATTNGRLVHVHSGSTLGTLRVARSTITRMGDLLVNASAAQVLLLLSDLSIVGCNRIAEGAGGAIVKYANVYFDGSFNPFYADGNMTLSGSGYSASAAARLIFSKDVEVAGGTVHVIDPHLQADVSTLALRLGDTAYSIDPADACGVGPVLCDGTHWKNLYTGATT